jgi:S-adenosylmethionine decarboxylase
VSGCEWIIEAHGCQPASLGDLSRLQTLFQRVIDGLGLHPLSDSAWHKFAGGGGITGICMLSESHIACHTFPEFGALCLNVFCCRPRPEWDFQSCLRETFGASAIHVRRLERPYGQP